MYNKRMKYDEEKVMEIFKAIFIMLIMTAFCVAVISGECDSDKPKVIEQTIKEMDEKFLIK